MQDWDKNKEVIKNKEKHIELSKWIAEFKQKQEDVQIQIATGKIDLKDAFAILTGKTTKGSILNSVGKYSWGRLSGGTRSEDPISIQVSGKTVSGLSTYPTIQRRDFGIRKTGALPKIVS